MRRSVKATIAALAVVAAVVLPAVPASAADPLPGPVVDIPELPSGAVARGNTSPLQTQALVDLWRIMTGRGIAAPGSVVPVTKPAVVPLTPTQQLLRGGGGGAAVLTSFNVGWALGQGGLALYSAATGTDYERMICDTPAWYQGANAFIMMGVTPDCGGEVIDANSDISTTLAVTYGGSTATLKGHVTAHYGNAACLGASAPLPPGYGFQTIGNWPGANWGSSTWPYGLNNSVCAAFAPAAEFSIGGSYLLTGMRVINTSTLAVVATGSVSTADPQRTPRCKITWEDSSVTTGTGTPYRESTGLPVSAAGFGCEQAYVSKPGGGPGLLPSRIEVESEDENGAITEISDQEVPDYTTPQRLPMQPGGNSTGLRLLKTVSGTTYSCNAWATNCSGWWSATSSGTTPGAYRCEFAGTVVDLVECGPYRHTFDAPTSNPTITDPTTGEEVGWVAQPTTGNSLNPGTGPGTGANPADACFETGWAEVANPVDWVLVPVKCALVWAFVPRTSVVQATTTSVTTAWADTMPAQLPAIVTGAFIVPSGDSSCQGPLVDLPINIGATNKSIQFYPLNACDGVGATLAGLSTLISSAILIWATALGIVRRGSSVVNAPGIGSAG